MAGLFVLILGLALYFLPTLLGLHKRNSGAIFALNLLLGWTFVGWIAALVWALTSEPDYIHYYPIQQGWLCSCCRAPLQQAHRFCSMCGTPIRWARF